MGYLRQKAADWWPALAVALLLAALACLRPDLPAPAAWVHEGICRELLAGTTEGRQALVASGWHAPLPTLAGLPAVALLPVRSQPWAGRVTAALALAALLHVGWRFARHRLPRGAALPAWLALAAAPFALRLCGDPALAVTVAAAATVVVKCGDWCAGRTLADLVKLGFALAALALCGFSPAGLGVAALLALPLTGVARRDLRPRLPGVLLLGALPLVYALAVWSLMCRLILMDSRYSLRFLRPGWATWTPAAALQLPATVWLAGGVCLILLLAGLWKRHAGAAVHGLLGLALVAWAALLRGLGLDWAAGAAESVSQFTALLATAAWAPSRAAARPGTPPPHANAPWRAAAALPLLLLLALLWSAETNRPPRHEATSLARQQRRQREVLEGVTAYVRERTPFSRVFVCGYAGLGLLHGQPRTDFQPCLDLHISSLRAAYHSQSLFLLVPRPEADNAVDSLGWRQPEIYARGAARALVAGDWGDWRLFEIVVAPTAEQLDAWRPAAP